MHWAEEIATQIIKRSPDKKEYVCAAGISPSGSIHIGNFRDVATSLFVVKALQKLGKKARLLFSWDEFDRLRKIPANVSKVTPTMEQYVGRPYVDVPNPFENENSARTYAEYFEKEFLNSIAPFGIELDLRYQAEMYRSGKYVDQIILSLQKRKEIFDILSRHRTQTATNEEREAFYPVSIYCPKCGRDTTIIHSLSLDCTSAEFTCECGFAGTFDFLYNHNCKLNWKVDWPMRWMYEGVDFEPGGKDHASPHGSYDVSKDIAREIFHITPPIFQGYEFIGIRGTTGKMSGSSGLNLTPATLLNIYQPEVILWLYANNSPLKAFNFCFDDGILRHYFEFDKMLSKFRDGTADEHIKDIMYYSLIPGRNIEPVPMSLLVQMGSVVNFNISLLESLLSKIGMPYSYHQFEDRLERAKYWLNVCAPEQVNSLRKTRNWAIFNELSDIEKEEIHTLHEALDSYDYSLEELNTKLYSIPNEVRNNALAGNELKSAQTTFFKNIYQLLLDKTKGPRLYLFLFAVGKETYLHLLDFSTPMTDDEVILSNPEALQEETPVLPKVLDNPDPVEPLKSEITIDDFERLDLRVCRVVKCQEIRKARNNFKLTLDDGISKRTIVSSLKGEYEPEELVGKKIIVIANLRPARITGTTSEGMLLAATNSACGCKVIFVDESVPVGTCIK